VDRIETPDDTGDPAARMLRSWDTNAAAWTGAVRERRIASRRAGTDTAIVHAVLAAHPRKVLDVGCGEGWLARELSLRGCDVVGIDASEALIDAAKALGEGVFETIAYADVADRMNGLGAPFDVAVCNFSLLEEDVSELLCALRSSLTAHGRLLIQTVHPWVANGDGAYADGWRTETFAGFGDEFAEPMPWYFRTLASWIATVAGAGFRIVRVDEPVDAESGRPLSLLIEAVPDGETDSR
jgi:2-polyprenyl-3-methyl-5-hydroxy-6-metoxy-1,4-benzoquinol methylase